MEINTETTPQGEQVLIPGVPPVTLKNKLQLLAQMPLLPRKPQKPLNIGIFDEDSRNQLNLF